MTDQTLIEPAEVAVQRPTMTLTQISKHYDGVAALTDVSFEVLPGEVHALLGENGAGKSTLMNVASGATAPDGGAIVFDGQTLEGLVPGVAQELGIAIVHQHPALLPDMTVAENILVAVAPEHLRRHGDDARVAMRRMLDVVGFTGHLEARVSSLSVARRHLLELAKAFAAQPKLLILDEPTAPLSQESVDLLFRVVRDLAAQGTAVVYITHRLGEVRDIADRVTVLRDGRLRGTSAVADITDGELLALIIGRTLSSTFPPKHVPADDDPELLAVEGLGGHGFSDISFAVRRGEIVGIAGVVGNGQPALLRTLAGLDSATEGTIRVGGAEMTRRALRGSSAYMPSDRHTEGLMMGLSVRENAALSALDRLKTAIFFISRRRELDVVERELSTLAVRAPSLEAPVSALSGGNQQKVVMARAMLSEPAILLADEPTQGVDVGSRAEIYRILREVADRDVPVVVVSSDAQELEGLCDRVVVMSRGHAVETLEGDAVNEERIIEAAVSATALSRAEGADTRGGSTQLHRLIQGDYAPVAILAVVMLALGVYVYQRNSLYVSDFNITSVMFACAALGFIALGQTVAMLLGGIDLSVGPLAGFLVVVGSFFILDEHGPAVWIFGIALMLACAIAVGLFNGVLIRYGKFTPVAATLVTYIALGGFAFVLRDSPDGYITADVTDQISRTVGPVPLAFVLFVVVAFVLEWCLRRTQWGLRLRAVGSDEESARRVGVRINRTALLGYAAVSALTFLGALVLLAQLGVGDPAQGTGYTLTSITAVVLGGTSLLGGRGTFIGTLLGAGLIVQVLNATTFLDLDQTWQYLFQGLLIVIAAVVYSQVRPDRPYVGAAATTRTIPEEQPVNLTGIHHTGLVVSDLDRSIYFYHDVLGLPFACEPTDWFSGEALDRGLQVPNATLRLCMFWVGPGSRLELLQYRDLSAAMERPYPNNTLGAGHVCLQVDDVLVAKAELEARGVEFYSEVNVVDEGPLAGWRWVYFPDPDGLSLELVEVAYADEAARAAAADAYLGTRPSLAALRAAR